MALELTWTVLFGLPKACCLARSGIVVGGLISEVGSFQSFQGYLYRFGNNLFECVYVADISHIKEGYPNNCKFYSHKDINFYEYKTGAERTYWKKRKAGGVWD